MRNFKEVLTDMVKKPPVLFPLVGLFHVLWLLWTVYDDRRSPFPGMEWVQVLWLFGYTITWLGACDLKKWGALGYIALTLIDCGLYLGVNNGKISVLYMSNLFLLDGLFSFFLVFYYRKFS